MRDPFAGPSASKRRRVRVRPEESVGLGVVAPGMLGLAMTPDLD